MKKITFLIVLFITFQMSAQWNNDTAANTLVADSDSGDMQSIATSDGQTYIVFWKVVAAPVNYELRLQLLDASGTKQFGNDGMLISNTIPMSTFTFTWKLATDSSNNLYVGVTGSSDFYGYAFKLDTSGTHLWGANGINTGGIGFSVSFLPLSTGETIISWNPDDKALMQKYDSSGSAIWGSPQSVIAGTNKTTPADMYELSNGDYIHVFHQRGSFGVSSTLYAQRYDSDGNAQWTNPTQLSNKATAYNAEYSGTQDGDNIYYGYQAATGSRFDSFLQKINPDGSLPWGMNGMDFDTNETNYEMETEIAFSPGSQYIWSLCTYTNTSQSNAGEYIQKFDKTTGVRQFTDNAKVVYPISSDYISHQSKLFLVDDHPVFIVNDGFDLNAVLLDEFGDFAWVEEQKPMATYAANKSRINFNGPNNGQIITTFIEDKGSGTKIYAQNLADTLLSIDELSLNQNQIRFKNPVDYELNLSSTDNINSILIHNALGQLIYDAHHINLNQVHINTQSWSSGLFFMTITTDSETRKGLKLLKR